MTNKQACIVVAGHICLDVIPAFPAREGSDINRIEPGQLYLMGPAVCATGGVVSNTGLALHQLGIPTTLMGKVGDDLFGTAVLDILRRFHPRLADGMIVVPGENTSYSVVISPPGLDRSFLHCPGANDTFHASDLCQDNLEDATLFHFGYPPLMEQIYRDGGLQLYELLERVRGSGTLTSLDMSMPDPQSAAGKVDWREWLATVLPAVDLFLPSIEEIVFMLDRKQYDERMQSVAQDDKQPSFCDIELLQNMAEQLLALGAGVVVLKLGEEGLYLRSVNQGIRQTTAVDDPLENADRPQQSEWQFREMIAPCFEVDVAGTTGAGDSTIAGLLAAIVQGAGPAEALVQAVAVGACSVEVTDATSGIRPMQQVQQRIAAGWQRHTNSSLPSDWSWDDDFGVYRGANDVQSKRRPIHQDL